jgi:alpha-L-rhamnosidase
MPKVRRFALISLALAGLCSAGFSQSAGAPQRLRIEYLENPLGLDETTPRFSWELDDARRGAEQTAYEIVVATDAVILDMDARAPAQTGFAGATVPSDAIVWRSGKVLSDATCHVEYAGAQLASDREYVWRVRTYDAQSQPSPWSAVATWRMGLLAPADWKARWIADSVPPVSGVSASFGWRTHTFPAADDLQWVQVDFGAPQPVDEIRLYPAREGASLYPVQYRVWMSDDPEFPGSAPIHVVDTTVKPVAEPRGEVVKHVLSGRPKARCFRLGILQLASAGEKSFGAALAELEFRDQGRVVSRGVLATCSDSVEEEGWSVRKLFDGELGSRAAVPGPTAPALALRHEFTLDAGVKRATAYATARGVYALRINGRAVGDQVLAPGWTDYTQRVAYQAYDATELVQQGSNAIALTLGDGWYAGDAGFGALLAGLPPRGVYGTQPSALVQLEIDLANGAHVTVASDGTWRCSTDGPIRENDLLAGETHDARRELKGWDTAGFVATSVEPAGSAATGWRAVRVLDEAPSHLVAQRCEPVRVRGELPARSVNEPAPGVYVFDFGRIVSGWCRLTCSGASGTTVELRHAEAVDARGALATQNLGGKFTSAAQTDRCVLRGSGRETFEPQFTLHGFRYVEVRGLASPPALGDLVAREVSSSARETATFRCSEPVLEGLWRNSVATQRAHLGSVFVANAAREERTGSLAEFAACARAALYTLDLAAFLGKWTADVRDARASDGRFRDLAPHPCPPDLWLVSSPGACDAAVSVPWAAWIEYGDRRLLERHVEAMSRHADVLLNTNRTRRWESFRGLDPGDRANGATVRAESWKPAGSAVPRELFATMHLWQTADTVARVRELLGLGRDPGPAYRGEPMSYRDLAELVRTTFGTRALSYAGGLDGDTQAGYALALATGIVPAQRRDQVVQKLVEALARRDGQLTTGVATTTRALVELSRAGVPADTFACDTRFPSLGWQLERGATTAWEKRDAFAPERAELDASSGDLSQLGFTSIGEWLAGWVAGLRPDEDQPGWKHFFIAPAPCARVTSASASHLSLRGNIETAWVKRGDTFELDALVPPNTTATIVLPVPASASLTEAGKPVAAGAEHVRVVERADGRTVLEVAAGRYHFRSGP